MNLEPDIKKLFWWVPEDKKDELSLEAVVEAVLSYGNENTVARLIDRVGIDRVAGIFYRQTSGSRRRVNYHPRTVNFFREYFRRNAPHIPEEEGITPEKG